MLDEIFMQILDMTRTAGIVILVVIGVRFLLMRAPKVFSYVLWAAVLFRLLCPVSFETPASVVPKFSYASETYSLTEEQISLVGASEAAYRVVGDVINGGLGIQYIRTTEKDEYGMTRYVTTDWWDVWILFGQYVWIAGVVVMVLYSVIAYQKFQKSLKVVVRLRDNIFVADDIHSPFVRGFMCPKIYLPCGLQEKEQEYIILHEQYHIKRRDHLVKVLAFLALSIHWFNPLVWLAFVLACKDMEMSCDEAVVRKMGVEIRADYAASLLTFSTGRRIISGTPLAFGEGDTRGRIKNLANLKKPTICMIIAMALVCVVLAVCLMTDPSSENLEDTDRDMANAVIMTPTEVDVEGVFDAYLYVPFEEGIYRYERMDMNTIKTTKDKILYQFTEKAEPEDVHWEVYAVKEYPDYSALLAVAGADYEFVYQYCPSKRSDPDALQQAKEDGCVIMEDGDVTFGEKIWQDFVKTTEEGKSDSIQVAHYYTLDPESCSEEYYQVYQEDYSLLYVIDLSYDGNSYTLCWNEGSKEYERNYKYLMCYTGEAPTSRAIYDTYTRYVLTNDNTVTWEDLWWGLISSQMGDYIDHYTIYTDLQ